MILLHTNWLFLEHSLKTKFIAILKFNNVKNIAVLKIIHHSFRSATVNAVNL